MVPFLEAKRLSKQFGGVAALDGCSLCLSKGLVTGLIGPNGAGKTTLLNVISGLVKPDAGSVHFDGQDITGVSTHQLASLGLVRTFQIVRELGSLTVLENLLLAPGRQRGETITGALFRYTAVKDQEHRNAVKARSILKWMGLWRLADQPASALSGGQKKLLELARALLLEPKPILLDEPAAGVAPPLLKDIIQLIGELKAEGISFGIVEHDMHLIGEVCDAVHVLTEGKNLNFRKLRRGDRRSARDRRLFGARGMTADSVVPALSIRGLRAGYGSGGDIVCGIDLDQSPETILTVIGPNGSGKSTFVKTLAGLLRPRSGSNAVTGRAVTVLSPAKRVAAGLAYVPQEENIFRNLTIRENLKLATEFLRGRAGVGPAQEEQVMALFPEIGRRPKFLAGNLSGGQRQMLAFACALLANPEVLLLDEPSAGLSPKFVAETMDAVLRVRDAGVTVLLVEQNVSAALRIADEVMVLVAGRKSLCASAAEISNADLADLFFAKAG